jgi:hypothetical protein
MQIDQTYVDGTLSAMKSVAEGHYENAITRWMLSEVAAGRKPEQPPVEQRRDLIRAAYDRVIANLGEKAIIPSLKAGFDRESPYKRPLEDLRDSALGALK